MKELTAWSCGSATVAASLDGGARSPIIILRTQIARRLGRYPVSHERNPQNYLLLGGGDGGYACTLRYACLEQPLDSIAVRSHGRCHTRLLLASLPLWRS